MSSAEKIKDRWNIFENFFIGITFRQWLKLVRENQVEWTYGHRAVFITIASLVNSVTAKVEYLLHSQKITETKVSTPPVFILGHWRSGTTLLHNILSQDTRNFCFPNTYQVLNPSTFLTTEKLVAPVLDFFSKPIRPMDNVAMGMKLPQEDEFAPLLDTLYSVYLSMAFPKRNDHYTRYLNFDNADHHEREAWKGAFLLFAKKLTLKNSTEKAILYKTPTHTARIKILLELFPDAKFIHISRNPYHVIRSSQHFFDTAVWKFYLQKPELDQLDDQIIDRYNQLHDSYFDHRELIPEGNLLEVKFEDFEQNPKAHIQEIYERLNLPDYKQVQPVLYNYIESLEGYKKNTFKELPEDLKSKVATRCARHFKSLNYSA